MSENANTESTSSEAEKPAVVTDAKFPPFPEPTDQDFEEDISEEERTFYKLKFTDLNVVKHQRLHCTACDRHLGCSARNESRMRAHPMLRTLMCHTCHTFYNSGEFEKGDDGSELYCRWCGQGGQVYCCSDCPHVFCAKCIKRNLGMPKIKEIESADDWKCFKCNSKCLWDLRALCWALLRYCDLKNKFTYNAQDPNLKEAYQKDCATDLSECCKHKGKLRKSDASRKREDKKTPDNVVKKNPVSPIPKMAPTIQVKKFASINIDELKSEKKAPKRPVSPKNKPVIIKNPIAIAPAPCPKLLNPMSIPPLAKKMKVCNTNIISPVRFNNERKQIITYPRIRPRAPQMSVQTMINNQFNGFSSSHNYNNIVNDNINLSLESLTQGLDMHAVAALANNNTSQDDDVVCTPDFPLEPLCEVTEDNTDDDVQCITPGPAPIPPKVNNPPPLVPCAGNQSDLTLSSDNIIQMTENDVTVNASTGGLKFRVDPQTLSSNKMYRLPDGRIFAINANPNMPGGYSATIVAVTENAPGAKTLSKTQTYSAKLSAVSTSTLNSQTSTPLQKSTRQGNSRLTQFSKQNTSKFSKFKKSVDTPRECDMQVPVEWYRYNLLDAVDALEYSLSRLNKLKKEATSMYLRTRTVDEMKNLHRSLDRLLNTSSSRFNEIRENLNKDLKIYLSKKAANNISEDDDDVEILPDNENDDPIFIDENSVDSNANCNDGQEVDLTGAGSSEHNDSAENRNDTIMDTSKDPLSLINKESFDTDINTSSVDDMNNKTNETVNKNQNKIKDRQNFGNSDTAVGLIQNETKQKEQICGKLHNLNCDESMETDNVSEELTWLEKEVTSGNQHINNESELLNDSSKEIDEEVLDISKSNEKRGNIQDTKSNEVKNENSKICKEKVKASQNSGENIENVEIRDKNPKTVEINEKNVDDTEISDEKIQDDEISDEKFHDTEMSDEMIESLLKDDNGKDGIDCT